jgi:hypothetical protein
MPTILNYNRRTYIVKCDATYETDAVNAYRALWFPQNEKVSIEVHTESTATEK